MPDVTLNITIPDNWTTRVLEAFNIITDKELILKTSKNRPDPDNDFVGVWNFKIDGKKPTENNKTFGERVLRELGKALIDLVDKSEDYERYKSEIKSILPPDSGLPNNILI